MHVSLCCICMSCSILMCCWCMQGFRHLILSCFFGSLRKVFVHLGFLASQQWEAGIQKAIPSHWCSSWRVLHLSPRYKRGLFCNKTCFSDLFQCLMIRGLNLDINGNSCVGDAKLLFLVRFWNVAVKQQNRLWWGSKSWAAVWVNCGMCYWLRVGWDEMRLLKVSVSKLRALQGNNLNLMVKMTSAPQPKMHWTSQDLSHVLNKKGEDFSKRKSTIIPTQLIISCWQQYHN